MDTDKYMRLEYGVREKGALTHLLKNNSFPDTSKKWYLSEDLSKDAKVVTSLVSWAFVLHPHSL